MTSASVLEHNKHSASIQQCINHDMDMGMVMHGFPLAKYSGRHPAKRFHWQSWIMWFDFIFSEKTAVKIKLEMEGNILIIICDRYRIVFLLWQSYQLYLQIMWSDRLLVTPLTQTLGASQFRQSVKFRLYIGSQNILMGGQNVWQGGLIMVIWR